MPTILFPRKGDRLRAHSVFFQALRVAASGIGVLSGMVPSRSSASAIAVASGTYRNGPTSGPYAGGSLTNIPAAASGKHRYDLVVFDVSDSTLKRIEGTEDTPTLSTSFLENSQPIPPELGSASQILLGVFLVTSSGISTGNFGHYATSGVANMIIELTAAHAHSNWSLLETYTQTETNLASAVSLKHSHANKTGLDKLTSYRIELCLYSTPAVLTASQTYPGQEAPVAGTITEIRCMSNDGTSGSISVALKKGTFANAPTTLSTIATAAISSSDKSEAIGQSIAVAAGDWIIPYINSVTSLKNVTVSLKVEI